MYRIKFISPLFLMILLLPGIIPSAFAQETSGGFAGSFSRMGFSPRGMAMGNAMTAVLQEGSYGYYNPAHAARKTNFIQLDTGTALLPFDRRLNMVHSHFQLPPSAGFSVSLLHAGVENIDGRDLNGYHTGYLTTNEFQLTGNFGIRFSEIFLAGIALKYNLARYHPEIPTSSGLGIDFGILVEPVSKLRIGITIQDLLASYRYNTSDLYGSESSNNQQFFPVRILAGVSYEISELWIISFDYENRRQTFEQIQMAENGDEGIDQFGRGETTSVNHFIRAGTRYQLHEWFTLRAGMQLNNPGGVNHFQPGAGFSVHLPYDTLLPSIDYAFVREPSGISTMHVFAIRLNI